MRTKHLFPLFALGGMLSMQSCTDNNYDLSDIDTTVGVSVNNLQIPINLDVLELDAILDLDDDSQIKKVDDGYAIIIDGTFRSDPINVPSFETDAPRISPIDAKLEINSFPLPAMARTRASLAEAVFSYDISDKATSVDVKAENVDPAIDGLESIAINDATLSLLLTFDREQKLMGFVKELTIDELSIQVIPGLDASVELKSGTIDPAADGSTPSPEYDPATGVISIPTLHTKDHKLQLVLHINGADSKAFTFDADKHRFAISQECKVNSGKIVATLNDLDASMLASDGKPNVVKLLELKEKASVIQFWCEPVISKLKATTFTGAVHYDIKGVNVEPGKIVSIPSFLEQEGTDLHLYNPQIYLEVTNPVSTQYGLYANAGITLTSVVDGVENQPCKIDEMLKFDQALNKFCISPESPSKYYHGTIVDGDKEYEVDFRNNTKDQKFTKLGDVLSGDKIPNMINIDIDTPKLPTQSVSDFHLGEQIDAVDGKYVFYAPLALADGTQICYSDTIDGWNDEDIDALTITTLKLNANITTDVPFDATLKAYPIDVDGKKIPGVVGTATVRTGNNQPLTVTVEGEMRHLDGIIFDTTVKAVEADGKGVQLSPQQTVKLTNVKATVSGRYEKEL